MRILVTGATGLLGGSLTRRLVSQKKSLRVFVRPGTPADRLERQGLDVCRGDLNDGERTRCALQGVDTVFHCAARVSPSGPWEMFYESNVRGTEMIFRECVRAGVSKVIYLSSLGVYGPPQDGEAIIESTPHDPSPATRGNYSHSKILAEKFVLGFAEASGLPVAIFRPGIIYGPDKKPPSSLLCIERGGLCLVVGSRNCLFPLTYVENLVDALLLAAEHLNRGIEQYNLVDDPDLTQEQFLKCKSSIVPLRAVFFPGWPLLAVAPIMERAVRILRVGGRLSTFSRHPLQRALQSVRYATDHIQRDLGWKPPIGLREALKKTLVTTPTKIDLLQPVGAKTDVAV